VPRHLLVRLQAPLIAFGGETIDNYGVTRRFPALSMMTGLFANALGWGRADAALHDRLQARLVMGTRLDAEGATLADYQTARLYENEAGWTTHGDPEGRAKSPSYGLDDDGRKSLTLQRYRDYYADLSALVAVRLEPADEVPTLEDLASALDHPARPLFIGRKPCLPSGRLSAGWCEAANILAALNAQPTVGCSPVPAQWPQGEGSLEYSQSQDLCDERNWISGVHGGWRPVLEGMLIPKEEQA
jgi:CRISPR system Cascade subunit CasD